MKTGRNVEFRNLAGGVVGRGVALLIVIGCSIQDVEAFPSVSAGSVHSWGDNRNGLVEFPEGIEDEPIVAVSAGSSFSLALTEDGRVLAWGGQDFWGDQYNVTDLPAELDGNEVVAISAGSIHSLALTADGQVVGWGNVGGGKLPVPEVPDWGENGMRAVSAGGTLSLALGVDPSRFWFWGSTGPVGAVEMPEDSGYKAISAGGSHCLAVTDDGRVVGWGYNRYKQVDIPEELTDGTHRVKKVSAGRYHSLALTEDGQLWGWGAWNDAETVQGEEASKYDQYYGFTDIAAGSEYSLAITVGGFILAWGTPEYNIGQTTDIPEKLTNKDHPEFVPVIAVSAGTGHALAVTMSAKVATPVIQTESFATQVNVTMSCETEGAAIYYTLDGSEPTREDGTPYSGFSFAVVHPATLKARAFKERYYPSETAEQEMIFQGRAITVSHVDFGSVAIGETASGKIVIRSRGQLPSTIVSVAIDSEDEGVFKVYFSGMVHIDPGEEIEVNASFAPNAFGSFEGTIVVQTDTDTRILGSDPVAMGTGLVPIPEGLKESGNYLNGISLEPKNSADLPMFYRIYTDEWSQWEPYSPTDELPIESPGTVRVAFKAKDGAHESEVVEKVYTIFTVSADAEIDFGAVEIGTRASRTVTLTSEGGIDLSFTGATYLASDWSPTGLFGDEIDWPLVLAADGSVELTVTFDPVAEGAFMGWVRLAFEDAAGDLHLPLSGGGYRPQVATPILSPHPDEGPFARFVLVEMEVATEDTEIYYSLDGSDPGFGSTLYDGEPVNLTDRGRTTVKARAFAQGLSPSEIVEAEYIVSMITVGTAVLVTSADGHLGLSVDESGEGVIVGFLESAEVVFLYEISITSFGKIVKTGTLVSHKDTADSGSPRKEKTLIMPVAGDQPQDEVIGWLGSDGSLGFDLPGIGEFSGSVDWGDGAMAEMAGGYAIDRLYDDTDFCYTVVASDGTVISLLANVGSVDACSGKVAPDGTLTMTTSGGAEAKLSIGPDHAMELAYTPQGADEAIGYMGLSAGEEGVNRLVNLSTRGHVGIGAQNMIAGFVITGTVSKPVLIRAMGPTLAESFGMTGTVADPMIEVIPLGGSTVVASNDDWENTQAMLDAIASTGAFAAHASGSKDAMLLAELEPGGYTATISGVGETEGVAIVEVYAVDDLDTPEARQVNISTRGYIGAGDSVMIMGLVAQGNAPRQFLIRAVGPTLSDFGITGVLEDPVLSVVRSIDQVEVATNDDWDTGTAGDAIEAMAVQLGAFALPPGSKDAVLLISLPPTSPFTVVVSGKDGATGVAIAEVYEVP